MIRIIILAALLLPALLSADVRLPALFTDHAVLQRNQPIHVWGWATAGEKVSVSFRQQRIETEGDSSGRFSVYLQPEEAGGPDRLEIRGKNRIRLDDVMVGEVWVASGQSNMEWIVKNSNNAEKEIADADHPSIRIFKVKLVTAEQEKEDVEGQWVRVSPETIPDLTAVGYFFARHLREETDLPIGVIQSAWGGTPAQAWTSQRTLEMDESLTPYLRRWRAVEEAYPRALVRHQTALRAWQLEAAAARKDNRQSEIPRQPSAPQGPGNQHEPAALYNAMIAPLVPYGIRGAIWYQGENNAENALGSEYRHLFRAMIEDWRRAWGLGDFPFLFVQLANYGLVSDGAEWEELRESQLQTLSVRNTGMAVTIDIGNPQDIHPRNKQDVGKRLALAALQMSYGRHDLVYSGPILRQAVQEGSSMRLWFDHVGAGLDLRNGSAGFEIAGADGIFHPATVEIDGESLVASRAEIAKPVAVRYAWKAAPEVTLFNKEGLPASPFRTDHWDD